MKIISGLLLFVFLGLNITVLAIKPAVRVEHLRTEMQENPVGLDIPIPRFMWQLSSHEKNVKQTAYRIQVASSPRNLKQGKDLLWDSGEVGSDNMLFIPYGGRPLNSRSKYYWRVKLETNYGSTGWSDIQHWTTAFLSADEWQAHWIGENRMSNPDETKDGEHTRLAARYLRKEFVSKGRVKRAMLYISGLGAYEAYLNGSLVSEEVLSPALSFYTETVYYNVFDITHLLPGGYNTLGVVLGNGRFFWLRNPGMEGFGLPRLLAQLEIEYENGNKQVIVSDDTWKVTSQGPIVANNEFDGEEYDMTKELTGWNTVGYRDDAWAAADIMEMPGKRLRAQPNPPIRVMERIHPVSIQKMKSGKYLVDMGQNMVGRLETTFQGKAGQKVTMRFAELLNPDSSLYTANLRTARATNTCLPAFDGTFRWTPSFVYHGFRYVEIDGLAQMPATDDIVGEVLYDDMNTIGSFETSDPTINRIYRNACWGIRGNYRSMPTDCPQRDERLGWLGDRATGCWGESFVFENALLYRKWLQDIEESQREDGCISAVSPRYWTIYAGDVTWSSAYFLAAEMLYKQFGDVSGIIDHYPSMKRWIGYIQKNSMKDDLVIRDEWGDWCMPPESPELIFSNDPLRKTDGTILGSTVFYHLLLKMSQFARLAGHPEDTTGYLTQAAKLKEAYNKRFFQPETAQYGNNSVTGNLLSLRHGLVPAGYEQAVFDNIVKKTEEDCNGHVSTGVVGIQHLMRGLTAYGRKDIAYRLTTHDTYPSWGYMIKEGATTIWELWNGNTAAPEMNSANHVMLLGDLIIWYYENLAGIKNAAGSTGFRHLDMHPCFPDGLEHVQATYRSVSGEIKSTWKRSEDYFSWEIVIPANCRATVHLPMHFYPNEPDQAGILQVVLEKDSWKVELGSGNYLFER